MARKKDHEFNAQRPPGALIRTIAVAKLIERNLRAAGYELRMFRDPEEALATFLSAPESFDALVTDQRMPGLTGLELAHAMRSVSPDLPVLLVTAYSEASHDGGLEEAGIRRPTAQRAMDTPSSARLGGAASSRGRRGSGTPRPTVTDRKSELNSSIQRLASPSVDT